MNTTTDSCLGSISIENLTLDQKICLQFGCRNMREVAKKIYEDLQKQAACQEPPENITHPAEGAGS